MTQQDTPADPGQLAARVRQRRRRDLRTALLYFVAVVTEFRWTLLLLLAATSLGTLVFATCPVDAADKVPGFGRALYAAWMALLGQAYFSPGPWYVGVINAMYPLFGFVLIGEGIIRFGMLMVSRRRGEKEWMNVKASTYRDHVVLAGLGHLGYRIFEQLHSAGVDVVILEADDDNPFVDPAIATGAPVLIRDMREDKSLLDAGIEHARAIVIAANKDTVNLEVALDSRRLNPKIRIVMRLYDQKLAEKIKGAIALDVAFSSSALAAPIVAAMSLDSRVLSSLVIGGVPHVVTELKVSDRSALVGKRVSEVELGYAARILARMREGSQTELQSPPSPATTLTAGDTLIIHAATTQLVTLASAGAARE